MNTNTKTLKIESPRILNHKDVEYFLSKGWEILYLSSEPMFSPSFRILDHKTQLPSRFNPSRGIIILKGDFQDIFQNFIHPYDLPYTTL